MYKTLAMVPAAIREFFREEVRNEPTGNMIDETYNGIDDNGDSVELTRQVEEMHDVIYVVEIDPPRFESLTRLSKIVDKNSMLVDIRQFIDSSTMAYLDSIQWAWFGQYKFWLDECDRLDAMPDSEIIDEVETPIEKVYPADPPRPAQVTVSEYQVINFEFFRRYLPSKDQFELADNDMINGTTTRFDSSMDVKKRWPKQ